MNGGKDEKGEGRPFRRMFGQAPSPPLAFRRRAYDKAVRSSSSPTTMIFVSQVSKTFFVHEKEPGRARFVLAVLGGLSAFMAWFWRLGLRHYGSASS